ncbi:protein mono-ADP-ribosyltransferase PARP16-like [Uranotaenia lowii]|uniref:protein mono-ADP-ribosyltransferase PARP16-like n=1 Tax=Uranotaenia lowii TaxID=190385 RepID=UPI002479B441|nr:protein mono-ADP-ribosyltransferase PARP16-like [Uranotaenia lowii]
MDSPNQQNKASLLQEVIDRDPKAADMRISLFVSAARSFKYDSCLQPFPSDYLEDREKNIGALNKVLDGLPPLIGLKTIDLDEKQVDLLYWLLCRQTTIPALRSVEKMDFESVFAKAPCLAEFQRPQYVFKVKYPEDSGAEKKFMRHKKEFPSYHAYHGSKVFNFYSILSYGLQQHLNKTALYGEGIYLSTELHVSQMFAPTGGGWPRSALGSHLSCTAVCEYIDNPAYVKCQEENQTGEFPEKYILIKNNEMVQVRYLLVYGSNQTVTSGRHSNWQLQTKFNQKAQQPQRQQVGGCVQWLAANKSWLLAVSYVLMLFAIGLMNNPNAYYMRKMFLQKINHMCSALFRSEQDTS